MSELQPNQRRALEALTVGHTVAQSAVIADVTESTIYRWKRQDAFKAELQRMVDETISDSVVFLSSCLMNAFSTMNELCINSESEQIRLSASKAISDSILRIRDQYEIIRRIAELEEHINEHDR